MKWDPTIQRDIIQCPVQKSQPPAGEQMSRNVLHLGERPQSNSMLPGQEWGRVNQPSGSQQEGIGTLPQNEVYLNPDNQVSDHVRGYRPFPMNEVARPVFVNHYYAGEAVATNRKLIRLEDCDVSMENSVLGQQAQGGSCKHVEHLQNSPKVQPGGQIGMSTEAENLQRQSREFHSESLEQLQNSLRPLVSAEKGDASVPMINCPAKGRFHSEFVEPSQNSQEAVSIGKSWIQATDFVNLQQVPLTGYEQFPQEIQTYPVSRNPVTVQPTSHDNNSALLDLPNVQTNLPAPLTPRQLHHSSAQPDLTVPTIRNQEETAREANLVSNTDILESIQNITKVMQQQLIFNSKTAEQGIIQTASLFQEMIKVQEKRDLDLALLAIPTFLGEAVDRPKCLDWISRVMNVCDQSGHSFRQELINKSGILVQNFIRSLGTQINNKELTEKILQFFSDVPTISHALNKLQLIHQGADKPIINYNQRYQNLVERVEGCPLNDIKSVVAMELYLGSVIEPIRRSIRNTLYFNSKHAPKTLGEAMLKAQDLHIKHLYAIGEEQQDSQVTTSDGLPEIMVNEVNTRENRGWYRNRHEFSEHSQNSHETPRTATSYNKKVTFD